LQNRHAVVPASALSRLEANDTTALAAASVTGGLGELVTASAKVILTLVHNNGTADDLGDLEAGINDVDLGDTLAVGLDVAEVTSVALVIGGSTVGLAGGVVVATSAGASGAHVTELVNVEAVLAWGEARDLAGHLDGVTLGGEDDGAHGAIGADEGNAGLVGGHFWFCLSLSCLDSSKWSNSEIHNADPPSEVSHGQRGSREGSYTFM